MLSNICRFIYCINFITRYYSGKIVVLWSVRRDTRTMINISISFRRKLLFCHLTHIIDRYQHGITLIDTLCIMGKSIWNGTNALSRLEFFVHLGTISLLATFRVTNVNINNFDQFTVPYFMKVIPKMTLASWPAWERNSWVHAHNFCVFFGQKVDVKSS